MTGPSPTAGPPSATQVLHFRDRRPPQEVQWQLERDLMELFTPVPDAPQYTLQATMKFGSLRYAFLLRYEAALSFGHAYVLTATLTDPTAPPTPVAELQRQLASWMGFWARDWEAAEPVTPSDPNNAKYQAVVQAARTAEAHLVTVHDLQQEILRRMRAGACFRTAHKEGGTTIAYANGRWTRADYGEWSTTDDYRSEAGFLAFLRKFFHYEVSRNVAPDSVPEETAWRLILRLLQPGPAGYLGPSRAARYGVLTWGMVVTISLVILFAKLRIWLRGRAPVPGLDALVRPAAIALGLSVVIGGLWLRKHWEPTPGAHHGSDDVAGAA